MTALLQPAHDPDLRLAPPERSTAVLLRDPLDLTLGELRDQWLAGTGQPAGVRVRDVATGDLEFHLDANPGYILIAGDRVEATRSGVLALGGLLKVPTPWLKRWATKHGGEATQYVLERELYAYDQSAITVTYGPGGLLSARRAGQRAVSPADLVEVAIRVLGTEDAPVVRLVDEAAEFAFDAHVPLDHGHAVGGDGADRAAGGLRVSHRRKQNLAPSAQPFVLREAGTNGYCAMDPGLRVDSRGREVEWVLAELEASARRAFSRTPDQIEALYDMRRVQVDNPERAILAHADDQDIPDRSTKALLELVPSDAMPARPTMFNVVNLISNLANHPVVHTDGGRLILECAAGAIISAHAPRCTRCQHKLTHQH